VVAIVDANQLRGDAKGVARLAYTTFQDVDDGKRLGDIGNGRLLTFVARSGVPPVITRSQSTDSVCRPLTP